MNNRYLKLAAILLLLVAVDVRAQFAVPKSNEVVEGELVLPDGGGTAHFFAREGAMVTVRSEEEQGYWYGIVPVIDKGQVAFSVFELTSRGDDPPAIREIASGMKGRLNEAVEVDVLQGTFQVKALDIQTWRFTKVRLVDPRGASPAALQKLYGASGGGLCSVSCGTVTITATSVKASCGTCQGDR